MSTIIAAIVALAFLAVGAGIGNRHNEYTLYQVPLIRTHVPIGVIRWT